jgi:hypothetical protein
MNIIKQIYDDAAIAGQYIEAGLLAVLLAVLVVITLPIVLPLAVIGRCLRKPYSPTHYRDTEGR